MASANRASHDYASDGLCARLDVTMGLWKFLSGWEVPVRGEPARCSYGIATAPGETCGPASSARMNEVCAALRFSLGCDANYLLGTFRLIRNFSRIYQTRPEWATRLPPDYPKFGSKLLRWSSGHCPEPAAVIAAKRAGRKLLVKLGTSRYCIRGLRRAWLSVHLV